LLILVQAGMLLSVFSVAENAQIKGKSGHSKLHTQQNDVLFFVEENELEEEGEEDSDVIKHLTSLIHSDYGMGFNIKVFNTQKAKVFVPKVSCPVYIFTGHLRI
jgi:hypothetical protein